MKVWKGRSSENDHPESVRGLSLPIHALRGQVTGQAEEHEGEDAP